MKKIVWGLIVCAGFLVSCSKSSSSPAYTPDCSGAAKSFSKDALPVFQSACVSCHSKFSSYSQIAGDKSAIRGKILDGSMPQGSSLSTAQKNNVVCWIDSGALNN